MKIIPNLFFRALLTTIMAFSLVGPTQAQQAGIADSSSITQENLLAENAGGSDLINLLSETAAQVSAGGSHTCALTTFGGVKCWGYNFYGQLGDRTTNNHSIPVDVVGLTSGVQFVTAGHRHTCALTTFGGVKCWGWNGYGQLGDGTVLTRNTLVDVVGLTSGMSAVSAGFWHTCALTTSGGVKCWGENDAGQLGDGTTTNRSTPVNVSGLSSGVSTISAGDINTCVLTTTGGVKCWGNNYDGQLGDGTNTNRSTPVDVVGLGSGVSSLSAEGGHVCALTTSGGIKCWGDNYYGQLGDGTTTDRNTPVDVVGLGSGVSAISTGIYYTCALTISGSVKCWGRNNGWQLGDGTNSDRSTPMDVVGLSNGVSAVNAGGAHTCAITTSGEVKCWGSNYYGQLGNGITTISSVPVDVPGLISGVSALSVGMYHACALITFGGTKCWGVNSDGQLGDGTNYDLSTPVDVVGLTNGVSALGAGGFHTCAITTSGGVWCWGENYSGQLGDGTNTDRRTPVDVVGLGSGMSALSAGGYHTCALTTSGGVKCWGSNYYGQLGDGTTSDRSTPVDVVGLGSGVIALSVGYRHTCVLTMSGGVKCWGSNYFGQLGDGTNSDRSTPTDVVGLTNGVSALGAGGFHTCVITTSGGVKCWGDNEYGQLGDGTNIRRYIPESVAGLSSGMSAISAGYWHTCALTTSGGVKCWGYNEYGQLGDGAITNHFIPVDATGLTSGVSVVNAGLYHTCASTTSGGAKCWGDNLYLQLGVNPGWTPVDVVGFEGVIPLEIVDVEINQGIGIQKDDSNGTPEKNFISGKPTAVIVRLNQKIPNDSQLREIKVKNGDITVCTLYAQAYFMPTDKLEFVKEDSTQCPNWLDGLYTFETTINGITNTTTAEFTKSNSLRILVVPIYITDGLNILIPPSDQIITSLDYLKNVYPIDRAQVFMTIDDAYIIPKSIVSIEIGQNLLMGMLNLRLDILNKIPLMRDYDLALGVLPTLICTPNNSCRPGLASYDMQTALVVVNGEHINPYTGDKIAFGSFQAIVAHEVGHVLGTGLGDEYEGGIFKCDINAPPKDYVNKDGITICSASSSVAWRNLRYGSLVSEKNDHPYEVVGRGDLQDSLSFMGGSQMEDNWISPDIYSYLFNNLSQKLTINDKNNINRVISARGTIGKDGSLELYPWYQFEEVPLTSGTGTYTIEALDINNNVVSYNNFDLSFIVYSDPPEDVDVANFYTNLAFPPETVKFQIKHGEQILGSRSVPTTIPTVQITSPVSGEIWGASEEHTITWNATDAIAYTLLYSPDGIDWSILATDLETSSYTINTDSIPGGQSALIRVIATNGVNSVEDLSGVFVVDRKPPIGFITTPREGEIIPYGLSYFITASAYDYEDGQLTGTQFHWSSNVDGNLGIGEYLLANLSYGAHTITLTVTDSDGNSTSSHVSVFVGSKLFLPAVTR